MLITFKEDWYNHVVYTFSVTHILTIEPWCIYSIILQGYVKIINKKVSNICPHKISYVWMNVVHYLML